MNTCCFGKQGPGFQEWAFLQLIVYDISMDNSKLKLQGNHLIDNAVSNDGSKFKLQGHTYNL